jgi:cystathionine gamma-synthase
MKHAPERPALATEVVHAGEPRSQPENALTTPIFQTATYVFDETAELVRFMEGEAREGRIDYGRYGNPTVRGVEKKVAELEGGEDAVAFGSGMAALVTTCLAFTKSGAHVAIFSDCYRRTRRFVTGFLARFGVEHTVVPPGDLAALERAIGPRTRLVITELPTNPFQWIVDLDALGALCRSRGVTTLVDSTFATPINLRPLGHGIDLVMHSATKYLSGHNDVLAGVVTGSAAHVSLIRELRHDFGGVLDPHAAYLVQRGMKTLALRVAQQNRSALALATALEAHPRVKAVWYPGLPSHPHHATARRLMSGFGGVVTFEVAGDTESVSRMIDRCRIPRIAPSLGGVESLIEQPALMSYFDLDPAQRDALGIRGTLVRYAVGVEDPDELIADLRQALG